MAELGLGAAALRARNPRLIYCNISGFGATGPYAQRPGFDQIAQGMSGLMSVTGTEQPTRVGIAIGDVLAGIFAAYGIALALYHRQRQRRRAGGHDLAARGAGRRAELERRHLFRHRQRAAAGRQPPSARRTVRRLPRRATAPSTSPAATSGSGRRCARRSALAGARSTTRASRRRWRASAIAPRSPRCSRRGLRRADAADWVTSAERSAAYRAVRSTTWPRCSPIRRCGRARCTSSCRIRSLGIDQDHRSAGEAERQTPGDRAIAPPELGADTDAVLAECGFTAGEIAALRAAAARSDAVADALVLRGGAVLAVRPAGSHDCDVADRRRPGGGGRRAAERAPARAQSTRAARWSRRGSSTSMCTAPAAPCSRTAIATMRCARICATLPQFGTTGIAATIAALPPGRAARRGRDGDRARRRRA